MKVGFIGSGKLGVSFGMYLQSQNVELSGYYNRNLSAAKQAAKLLSTRVYETLEDVVQSSDIIGITVNDDQINNVVDAICRLTPDLKKKIFFHMSGAHDCLYMKKIGSDVFSLHPLKAFPQIVSSSSEFDLVVFSLENSNHKIKNWIDTLNIEYFEIESSQKAKYHAAAVIVSNYLVSLVDFGLKQFIEMGMEKDMALRALWPLVTGTIQNIEQLGTDRALTGPIVRGDVETIQKHLDALSETAKPLYKALGQYTMSLTHHDDALNKILNKLFE